jgi:hypothetical protein
VIRSTLLVAALLVLSPLVMAQAKGLHDASCLQCHASLTGGKPTTLYTRADRKVKSLASLQQRVKGCAIAADANWSDSERTLVVNFLSAAYYHF